MKPTRERPPASVTSVASSVNVVHAAPFFAISLHVTTRNTSIRQMTASATVAASTYSAPKIHNRIAISTSTARMISLRFGGPIVLSSLAAHFGASSLFLSSGGMSQYANSGSASRSGSANGSDPIIHCAYEISTLAILRMNSSARKLGAHAVMNSELVMQPATNVVHMM